MANKLAEISIRDVEAEVGKHEMPQMTDFERARIKLNDHRYAVLRADLDDLKEIVLSFTTNHYTEIQDQLNVLAEKVERLANGQK